MTYFGTIMGYRPQTGGLTQLQEGAPSFDGVAERALSEQEHGSEGTPQEDPVLDKLVDRLNAVQDELSDLSAKIWGPPGYWKTHDTEFKGPAWLERERLHAQIRQLEEEEWSLKGQIRELAESSGLLPRE